MKNQSLDSISEILNCQQTREKACIVAAKRYTPFKTYFYVSDSCSIEENAFYIISSKPQLYYLAFWLNSVGGLYSLFGDDIDTHKTYVLTKKALSTLPIPIATKETEKIFVFIENLIEQIQRNTVDTRYDELKRLLFMEIRDAVSLEIMLPEAFKEHNINIIQNLFHEIEKWEEQSDDSDSILIDLMKADNKVMNNIKLMNLVINHTNISNK